MFNSELSFEPQDSENTWNQDITTDTSQNVRDFNSQMERAYSRNSVFDVAKYVLHILGPMTTMKLQKLVYYCQAWSLAWDEEPLFNEDFQAWANGPVCPELYALHKGQYYISEADLARGSIIFFTDNQIESMNTVIKEYGDKSPQWLSELTHKERPWKEARGDTPLGDRCDNIIAKESMQDYYAGLL